MSMPWKLSDPALMLSVGLLVLGPAMARAGDQQANSAARMVDVETVGPKVGQALPDFSLPDQHGQMRSLKSLLGPNGAVIVFVRSADW
jgi:cytochrome oxidase Cu insertion factor (SCO1/SenC/PrrC family)